MVLSATGSLGALSSANSLAIGPESMWELGEEATAPETHVPQNSDDACNEMRHVLHLQGGVALKKVKAEIPVTEKPDANDSPVQAAELSGFEMGGLVCVGLSLTCASILTVPVATIVFLASLSQLKEDASLYIQKEYLRFLAERILADLSRQKQPEVWRLSVFFQSHPLALNALLEVACDRKDARELSYTIFFHMVTFLDSNPGPTVLCRNGFDEISDVELWSDELDKKLACTSLDLMRRFICKYADTEGFIENVISLLLIKLGRVPSATGATDTKAKLYNVLFHICLDKMGRSHLDVKDETVKAILENPNVHVEVKYAVVKLICKREEPIPQDLFGKILSIDWSYVSEGGDCLFVSSYLPQVLIWLIDKNKMDWNAVANWYGKKGRILLLREWRGINLLIEKAEHCNQIDTLLCAAFPKAPPEAQLELLFSYKERSKERCRIWIEGLLRGGSCTLASLDHRVEMAMSEILFCDGPMNKTNYPGYEYSSTGVDWRAIHTFLWTGNDVEASAEVAIHQQASRIARGEVTDPHELSFFVKVLSSHTDVLNCEDAFGWIVSHPQYLNDWDVMVTAFNGLTEAFSKRDSATHRVPFAYVLGYCENLDAVPGESRDKLKAIFFRYLTAHFQYHRSVPLPPQLKCQLDLLGIVYGIS